METTATRLLRLLPLLTSRAHWPGDELARRLGVTTRTVRRDIDRLRELGYPIHASPGAHGGYVLRPGGALPPLLLDDDAAVAVAIALRTVAADPALREPAARAAAAIDQVLPARLRRQVEALLAATIPVPVTTSHNVLAFLASACQSFERLRFGYKDATGNQTSRHVEPYRLVFTGSRWYLVARDVDKGEWRSFRLDRVEEPYGTGVRSRPASPPDAVRFVTEGMAAGPYRWRARVLLRAPAEVVAGRVPPKVAVIESAGPDSCELTTGSDSLDMIAMHLIMLDIPFTILDPPELAPRLTALATRLTAAAAGPA